MPQEQRSELYKTIETFGSLIESYLLARDRLIQKRSGASGQQAWDLDKRIAVNGRTLETLERAVASLKEQAKAIDAQADQADASVDPFREKGSESRRFDS